MDIGSVVLGFLIGFCIGPAAGFYVGLVTGFMAIKNVTRVVKGKAEE